MRAVNKYQGLLRMSVASAGNDHRLGANEAPPAIISIFLGDMLTGIFEQIEKGATRSTTHGGLLETGVDVLPKLPRDAGDRNRTSPFAFTGNKFEFRAVSSNQSIAFPNIVLNVAVAESLDYIATELEKAVEKGADFEDAVGKLLVKLIKENKRIIFNGNGYSDAWQKEAGKRGLLNLRNTVDALPQLTSAEAVKLFEAYKVLNKRELEARLEINFETYNKSINVEAQTMVLMANRYILPAALGYLTQVAQSVAAGKAAGVQSKEAKKLLVQLTKLVDTFKQRTEALTTAIAHEGNGDSHKHAKYMRDKIVPAMAAPARDRRRDRVAGPVQRLAAADVSRDAVHQVAARLGLRAGLAPAGCRVPGTGYFSARRQASRRQALRRGGSRAAAPAFSFFFAPPLFPLSFALTFSPFSPFSPFFLSE